MNIDRQRTSSATMQRAQRVASVVAAALLMCTVLLGNASGAGAAAVPFQLTLPIPWNATINAGGPHPNSGYGSGTRNAVDLGYASGATMAVEAAAPGVLHFHSASDGTGRVWPNCYATINHAGGWQTQYWHLTSALTRLAGTTVQAGQQIANDGFPGHNTCGVGDATHLHFSLWHNGAAVAIDGTAIGGYTVHQTGGNYCGYWTLNSTGAVVADARQACQMIPKLANNQVRPQNGPAPTPIANQAHGLCLDAAAQTDTQVGGIVQLWQCVGDTNQLWSRHGNTLVSVPAGLCLDAKGSTDGNNGGTVELWPCNGGTNQQWVVSGTQLVNQAHGLCLDANWNTDGNNGGLVQLWACNGGANQGWGSSPPPPATTQFGPYHVIVPGGGTLYVRGGPGTNYPATASLANGATFYTYCQAPGTNLNGNGWWDKLTTGGYISDYYTSTPGEGPPASGIPRC